MLLVAAKHGENKCSGTGKNWDTNAPMMNAVNMIQPSDGNVIDPCGFVSLAGSEMLVGGALFL